VSIITTTTTPAAPAAPAMPDWTPSPLYRMSVEEYEALAASGALAGRKRIHLIDGLLVEKMTQNPPHMIADTLCGEELARVIPAGWQVLASKPIRLPGQGSMPEPDRCVVRGSVRDYRAGHPEPADIALVIEVSDATLADDRAYGARLYGPARTPVYWIINLIDCQVEVHTNPGPVGYASRTDYRPGQVVPVVIDGRQVGVIAVDDILP
jgi:Uma2 family endonuclease